MFADDGHRVRPLVGFYVTMDTYQMSEHFEKRLQKCAERAVQLRTVKRSFVDGRRGRKPKFPSGQVGVFDDKEDNLHFVTCKPVIAQEQISETEVRKTTTISL